MKLLSTCIFLAASASLAAAGVDYLAWSTQTQVGDGTFYGQGGDDRQGACSFSENFADTNNMPWTKVRMRSGVYACCDRSLPSHARAAHQLRGLSRERPGERPRKSDKNPHSPSPRTQKKKRSSFAQGVMTTIALNDQQFSSGAACGLCLKFRGTGEGLGTTPISTEWARGFVNNRCPECAPGDIDIHLAGDGRWKVEWMGALADDGGGKKRLPLRPYTPALPLPSTATPCDVGGTPLSFKVVVSNPFWASIVISNTAVPVAAVQVNMNGAWQDLTRAFNNQWAVHGDWRKALPIPIRVTAVTGETVEDAITGEVTEGTVQFTADGDVNTGANAPTGGFGTKPAGREFSA